MSPWTAESQDVTLREIVLFASNYCPTVKSNNRDFTQHSHDKPWLLQPHTSPNTSTHTYMQTHKQSPTRESETRSCSICLFSLKNYTCSTDVSDTQMRTGPNVIKPWEVLCLADLLEGCLFYSGLTCLLPPQLSCCVRGVLCVLAVPLQHTMSNTEALINQLKNVQSVHWKVGHLLAEVSIWWQSPHPWASTWTD